MTEQTQQGATREPKHNKNKTQTGYSPVNPLRDRQCNRVSLDGSAGRRHGRSGRSGEHEIEYQKKTNKQKNTEISTEHVIRLPPPLFSFVLFFVIFAFSVSGGSFSARNTDNGDVDVDVDDDDDEEEEVTRC